MAASTLVFDAPENETTLVAQCYTENTVTLATNGTSNTATELSKGKYSCTFTDLATGIYDLRIKDSGNNTIATGTLDHTNSVGVERPASVDWRYIAGKTATVNLTQTTIKNVTDLETDIEALNTSLTGPGADQVTLTISTSTGVVADADVWITSDAAGDNVIAGTRQTNSDGQITFLLDDGNSYYLWMQKDGIESIDGELFTAEAD